MRHPQRPARARWAVVMVSQPPMGPPAPAPCAPGHLRSAPIGASRCGRGVRVEGVAPLPGNGRRAPGGSVASRRRRRLGQHPSARGERHKRSGRAPGPVTERASVCGSYLPGRRMPVIMKAGCE
eukprot:scaffold8596_cov128-Isochrysis_galbana.AAC.4